jgi:hypothetical protein
MNRRDFLSSLGAVAMLPAMPIDLDPMVRFISYQSWPLGEPQPLDDFMAGTIEIMADKPSRRLSQLRKPHMTYIREIR